jgi:hypothetical protein
MPVVKLRCALSVRCFSQSVKYNLVASESCLFVCLSVCLSVRTYVHIFSHKIYSTEIVYIYWQGSTLQRVWIGECHSGTVK